MSTTSHNAKPAASRTGAGTTPKSASPSNSDWLGPTLLTARTMVAASENAPVPFVKGVFGTILIVLETIDNVKKNRENLKQLCGNVIKIMKIVEGHIVFCEDVELSKLESLCADLESTLQEILRALKKRQTKPKGVRGHFKEMLYSSDIAGEIVDYEKKIQELQLSFMVNFLLYMYLSQ
ncbi:hypothetical protein GGX14DRAFT_403763 [Mycena pura]|uniref:Uncharacterized protein n=1 Tax=Mycena pura TaxID=153505 RepID=A0AAD6Y488_9AGAR|nr:hypothetical protein GGX14DRAFT_403763 [Mycena pura]